MLSILNHCIPGWFVTQQVRTDTGETLLYETQSSSRMETTSYSSSYPQCPRLLSTYLLNVC